MRQVYCYTTHRRFTFNYFILSSSNNDLFAHKRKPHTSCIKMSLYADDIHVILHSKSFLWCKSIPFPEKDHINTEFLPRSVWSASFFKFCNISTGNRTLSCWVLFLAVFLILLAWETRATSAVSTVPWWMRGREEICLLFKWLLKVFYQENIRNLRSSVLMRPSSLYSLQQKMVFCSCI